VNTKQLAPITGALIAGLIGVEAADCYGWITSLCKSPNTYLAGNYPGCQNPTGGNDLYTTGAWTRYEAYEIYEPGDQERARHADTRYCSGLASYLDCQGYPHTINYTDYSTGYFGTSHDGYPPPCEW
jgi:hypothetical protein